MHPLSAEIDQGLYQNEEAPSPLSPPQPRAPPPGPRTLSRGISRSPITSSSPTRPSRTISASSGAHGRRCAPAWSPTTTSSARPSRALTPRSAASRIYSPATSSTLPTVAITTSGSRTASRPRTSSTRPIPRPTSMSRTPSSAWQSPPWTRSRGPSPASLSTAMPPSDFPGQTLSSQAPDPGALFRPPGAGRHPQGRDRQSLRHHVRIPAKVNGKSGGK